MRNLAILGVGHIGPKKIIPKKDATPICSIMKKCKPNCTKNPEICKLYRFYHRYPDHPIINMNKHPVLVT